ncbi:unnamed protein product [Parnassius apollo]|uniref:(apollo) hypothetical protein n=1 Tax=Parnassius apollo TaxID=110799 RepID=A0A8S3X3V1_PARAO|nr:unnamed protein product [Parnassius apollo]
MSSTFEDSFLDFDFNFLQQTPKNVMVESKIEKQRKAILIAKKKIIATDSLIKKYYAKKETLDQTEKYLIASKEECKQVCIEYNSALEKCTRLEKDTQLLSHKNQELEERLNFSENQCKAIQSHAYQLQVLAQEHETQIESLKIENQLEKSNTKEQTKSKGLQKHEYDTLISHICLLRDIVLGKRKLNKRHKVILQKYDKLKPNSDVDDGSASDSSVGDMDDFEHSLPSPMSPDILSRKKVDQVQKTISKNLEKNINKETTNKRIDGDQDSDSCNEIISEDTGRGSSLANSDIEKCLNSPDYYISDSPFSNVTQKDKKNYSDAATSPITVNKERIEIATSPIPFTDTLFTSVHKNKIITKEIGITVDSREFIFSKSVSTSPISNRQQQIKTRPVDFDKLNSEVDMNNTLDYLPKDPECLELHTRSAYKNHVTTKEIGISVDSRELITSKNVGTSPIGNKQQEIATSPVNFAILHFDSDIKNSHDHLPREQECEEMRTSSAFKIHVATKEIGIEVNSSDFIVSKNVATSPVRNRPRTISMSPVDFVDFCIDSDMNNSRDDLIKEQDLFEMHTWSTYKSRVATKEIGISVDFKDFVDNKSNTTSPTNNGQREMATSPVIFNELSSESILNKSNDVLPQQRESHKSACKNQIATKEVGTAAEFSDFISSKDIATSPISSKHREIATSPVDFYEFCSDSEINNSCNKLSKERECLEINNSNILNNNHSYDREVEKILTAMRFDYEIITPIPISPAIARNTEKNQNTQDYVCQDAAKVGKENAILKATMTVLAKEVQNVKTLLHKHLRLNDEEIQNPSQYCNKNDTSINSVPLTKTPENIFVINEIVENTSENSNITVDINQFMIPELKRSLNIDDTQDRLESIFQNNTSDLRDEITNKDHLHKSPTKTIEKLKRAKKLTRLENLRKKLIPQSKIRRAKTPPIRQLRRKKQLLVKKKFFEKCTAVNNKIAYENAVKIMAELKSKQKDKSKDISIAGDVNTTNDSIKDNSNEKRNSKDISISGDVNTANDCKKDNSKENNNSRNISMDSRKTDDFNQDLHLIPTNKDSPLCDVESTNHVIALNETTPEVGIRPVKDSPLKKSYNINVDPQHSILLPNSITTRSRSKRLSSSQLNEPETKEHVAITSDMLLQDKSPTINNDTKNRRRLKRVASDQLEVTTKRILRSSNVVHISNIGDRTMNNSDIENSIMTPDTNSQICKRRRSSRLSTTQKNEETSTIKDTDAQKLTEIVTYSDLDIFIGNSSTSKSCKNQSSIPDKLYDPKESILCRMLEKYARYSVKCNVKKIPDSATNSICSKLEEGIAHILTVPLHETKNAMNNFVNEIQNWNVRNFMAGFMKYLKDPARKDELFNKVHSPPAPHMTKSEQVLIYILKQLQALWPSVDLVKVVFSNIEFALFQLNHAPEFSTVESLSHFYAVLCRYFRAKSRLRLFILDAMYCMQYKSVAVIKQCLDVWMHVLPLAHMGIAKSPLVTCLVYLLHFYKCEDKFNRVQDIREILSRKYFYKVTDWTETKILEMFKNAIKELRDVPIEKKMLRMSLIILAKRRGPQWCQKNLVKNMLQPIIEKEDVPDRIREFSVSVLGPLLKPYPNDMKVHCEIIVNQLLDMLECSVSPRMKEAIFTTLLYMKRHNQTRVTQALLSWNPQHVSPELEELLKDYVREKPFKVWRNTLSRISVT